MSGMNPLADREEDAQTFAFTLTVTTDSLTRGQVEDLLDGMLERELSIPEIVGWNGYNRVDAHDTFVRKNGECIVIWDDGFIHIWDSLADFEDPSCEPREVVPPVADEQESSEETNPLSLSEIRKSNPEIDETDMADLLRRCGARWAMMPVRPLDGDMLRRKDGSVERVGYVLSSERVQPGNNPSGVYLNWSGGSSYSGGMDASVQIEPTDEVLTGHFWFFHHGQSRANNGIDVWIPVRVWQEV